MYFSTFKCTIPVWLAKKFAFFASFEKQKEKNVKLIM